MSIDRPVYFDGYWQHEEYFLDIAEVIRQDLKPAFDHDSINTEFGQRIRDSNGVCLHVRKLHGVPNVVNATSLQGDPKEQVDMSYYHRAIDHIRQTVDKPHFFRVFGLPAVGA